MTQPSASSARISLKERLRLMRTASALARERDGASRSHSVASSTSESSEQTQRRSVQQETRKPPVSGQMLSSPRSPVLPPTMDQPDSPTEPSPVLGVRTFAVLLPMTARIRDHYQQLISDSQHQVEPFMTSSGPTEPAMYRPVLDMISQVKKLTVHPDLILEETMDQEPLPVYEEAKWAESCSAKYVFLRYLLDALRGQPVNIAVLAQAGQSLEILENFLRGNNIAFYRPDNSARSDSSAVGPLKVALLPTGKEGEALAVEKATAIIAFDGTFSDTDRHVQNLRTDNSKAGYLSPVIYPIIVNSAEHIDLCLPRVALNFERLRELVVAITQARYYVGHLPTEYPPPSISAQQVAEFVSRNDQKLEWPLPPIRSVVLAEERSDSEDSDASPQPNVDTHGPKDAEDEKYSTHKRPLVTDDVDDDSAAAAKKLRLTPVLGDGLKVEPQSYNRWEMSVSTEGGVGNLYSSHLSSSKSVGVSVPGGEALDKMKRGHQEAIRKASELRAILQNKEAQLQEHIESLSGLQFRFEDLTTMYRELRAERDQAKESAAHSKHRMEVMEEEVSRLKEIQSSLEEELKNSRSALLSSAVPNVAELEKARQEARRLMAEKERLEKSLAATTQDFNFTRSQYQTASSAAADSTAELEGLREENEVLRRKANGEALKLHELSIEAAVEMDRRRIEQLELMLEDRTEMLSRMQEALRIQRDARSHGISTRSGSVPRSPKAVSGRDSPSSTIIAVGGHPLRTASRMGMEGVLDEVGMESSRRLQDLQRSHPT